MYIFLPYPPLPVLKLWCTQLHSLSWCTHTQALLYSASLTELTHKKAQGVKKKRKVFTLLYWLSPPSDRIVPELVFRWGASSSAKGTFLQQVNNTCQQCNNACELCCSHSYLSTVLQQVNVQNPSVNPSSISPFLLFPITSSILQQVIHTSKSHLTFANKGGQKKKLHKRSSWSSKWWQTVYKERHTVSFQMSGLYSLQNEGHRKA